MIATTCMMIAMIIAMIYMMIVVTHDDRHDMMIAVIHMMIAMIYMMIIMTCIIHDNPNLYLPGIWVPSDIGRCAITEPWLFAIMAI